ncbi:MAG TPA: HAMP domain-containing protein [Gammaproteobacteria bacterium]|nr:HAMP domain-containing protein [Gammaproteobacteria bacterium]
MASGNFITRAWRNLRIPIGYKLAIAITLLITSAMLLLGLLLIDRQGVLLRADIARFGHTVANQVADSAKELVLAKDELGLKVLVTNLTRNENISGTAIISANDKVLARSGLVPPENEIPQIGMKEAPEGTETHEIEWYAPEEGIYLISFISPIHFQDVILGYSLATFSRQSLVQSLQESVRLVVTITLAMILLGIGGAFILGGRIARPIRQLIAASREIKAGNYEYRIAEQRSDELGQLMVAFNEMAQGLRKKVQVEQAFSRFVPENVAKHMLSNIDQVKLGGETVTASVLFADIVGYTSLSEKLSAAEIAELLNEYFSYIADAAKLCGGTLDKYVGDCAMILFGVPEHDPKHAFHAIYFAVLLKNLIERLNTQRLWMGKIPIQFSIGVNCGSMLAGTMGSKNRMQYTVLGDAVNLASRLSGVAEAGEIIISEGMLQQPMVGDCVEIGGYQSIAVRGKGKPVATYRVDNVVAALHPHMYEQIDSLLSRRLAG